MIRKCTRSILARLEALEEKSPGSLIFEVPSENGRTKRVNLQELMKMREEPHKENGICYTGFPEWRIVEGKNLKELDMLLSVMPGNGVAI